MSRADQERGEIIRHWRSVELFSPPAVVEKVNRARHVYAVKPGEPLPWDPAHKLARCSPGLHSVWRHVVYLGIYSLASVFDVLSTVFSGDEDSFDERPPGESALAAFAVTAEGRPLIGSEVLSSCAWATGRALYPGPGSRTWLDGFENASSEFSATFADLVAPDPAGQQAAPPGREAHSLGRPMERQLLARCLSAAADQIGAGWALPHTEIRIQSHPVALRSALATDGRDFLNSFIFVDLRSVADQVRLGRMGPALRQYLRADRELDAAQRVDVQSNLHTVLDLTAPLKVPLGRWPSDPCHPLALSQQLAVNGSLQLASQAGVFAVNGPPGTGKTTMLRDLVAALVVERARRLATLAHPTQAFTGRTSWKTGERTRVVHIWRPELTGFEMVVASANNGAVENVTHEIPARAAVAGQWQQKAERLDYFPEIASALLTVDRDEEDDEPDRSQEDRAGWALMAARLGNKLNRGRFVDQFWYGKTSSSPTGAALGLAPEHNARDNAQRGLLSILKGFERSKPPSSWADAVAAFRRACDAASLCQAARGQAYAAVTRSVHLERELQAAQAQAAAAQQRADVARARLAEARDATRAWHDEHRRRVIVRSEHRQFRPRFLEWLTSLGGAMREWRRHDQHLAAQLAQAEAALSAAHTEVARLAEEAAAVDRQSAACRKAQLRKQQEAQALRAVLAEAQTQLGAQFPDQQWWEDRDRRERATLWTDPEWNRVRTEVFLEALRLHKAFLEHEPTRMRQSLQAATDLVAGDAPSDLPEETALAAWRSLLFVVPVISTTFASFARLFSHLGREPLGWLFVDEAGQATPQSTVGALWRSRRAVVLGDPLQLEPITTLPFRAEQAIRNSHGVDELWLSSRTSVQRLADRSSPLGTWLPGDEGNIWVGAPLTLHRRCDEPMFGIANRIAYGGLMIYGTGPDQASQFLERYPPHRLPMSKWVDVRSDTSEGHWKPAEGEQLDRILRALARLDFDFSQVMVIAPFRDVASQVQHRASSYNGLVAGTIHTAQGKQADIVILVLGGDPARPGAKFWAASKPNLLNVAVSRAKRRLYVIGDRRSWGQQHYFDVLARELP